jgi:hypothetical protein
MGSATGSVAVAGVSPDTFRFEISNLESESPFHTALFLAKNP